MSEQAKPTNAILPLALALALSVGVAIGYIIGDKSFSNNDVSKSTQKFGEIINHINESYVDSIDVVLLSENLFHKIKEELDPHTRYIPLENQIVEEASLQKEFAGIGIEFRIVKDTIFVLKVLEGSPAEKGGMMSGDKIVKVDDQLIVGAGINEAVIFDRLKGEVGEPVSVSVKRRDGAELISLNLIREKIEQRSLNVNYMIDKSTGYLKLSKFNRDAGTPFEEAIKELKSQGMKNLIVDLRGNPGGLLSEATDIADQFLKDGDTILYTHGRPNSDRTYYRAEIQGAFEEGPLIILIDEKSASASEIVAGALQDNDRALLVGRRTYAKGLVQTPIKLSDGSGLILTTSRYFTPSGRCIQKSYDNLDLYSLEPYSRSQSGELYHADSIKNIDSLKFKTVKGRTVYGGGGITPDIFVPDDTSHYSAYFNKLYNSNLLIEYSIMVAQDQRDALRKKGLDRFVKSYKVSNRMITNLAAYAEKRGVPTESTELWNSAPLIAEFMKSYIAKELWDNLGFYKVRHSSDSCVKKALASIQQAEELTK